MSLWSRPTIVLVSTVPPGISGPAGSAKPEPTPSTGSSTPVPLEAHAGNAGIDMVSRALKPRVRGTS